MLAPIGVTAAADSARAVAQVYTASLAALVPVLVAALAALVLRRSPAGTRALVWRAAMATLLVAFIGRVLPVHWVAWVLPEGLAEPLVALGRVQVASDSAVALQRGNWASHVVGSSSMIAAVLVVYVAGALLVLFRLVTGWRRVRALVRAARATTSETLTRSFDDVCSTLGITRRVRLLVSAEQLVPITTGVLRPVVVLPSAALEWDETTRRAVLVHELSHVRAGDAVFVMASRVMCALYWFHPAAWWIADRLHRELELACDDRVLSYGVRPSAYADVLVRASDWLDASLTSRDVTMAAVRRTGLRERLDAIVNVRRTYAAPRRASVVAAAALTMVLALPLSTVRLAPTRGVLDALMRDTRWESRAYAVLGLAQRADSVAVARSAATGDPSARVRAWARYALTR